MNRRTIALFGEAEKGCFQKGYLCQSLSELESQFGNPPQGTKGLFLAVQTLLFNYKLIFFRVEEEGYSLDDYLVGFQALSESEPFQDLLAIGLPGVGDTYLIKLVLPHTLVLTTESDFYDILHQ